MHSLKFSPFLVSSFSLLALSRCQQLSMPITEQEAILWSGTATADQLSALPHPRIPREQGLSMLDFSSSVIHSFFGGPHPPLFTFPDEAYTRIELQSWCRKVLQWDKNRRKSVENDIRTTYFYSEKRQDEAFLKTFGHKSNITSSGFPFLRVSNKSACCSKGKYKLTLS